MNSTIQARYPPRHGGGFKILLFIATLIFPPIGVFMIHESGLQIILNLILTLVFAWIPGHLHAFYLEYKYFKGERPRTQMPIAAGTYQSQPPPVAHDPYAGQTTGVVPPKY